MTSNGKVAIVTGGGSGIGRHSALALVNDGYSVAIGGRRISALEETIAEAGDAGDRMLAVATDVTDIDSIRNLFVQTHQKFGRLDVLFNNGRHRLPAHADGGHPARSLAGGREHQPHRLIHLHAGSHQDNEGAGPHGRPHHQQRLNLRVHAPSRLRRIHRHQALHHRPHQIHIARRAQVQHRLRADRHRQRRDPR